MTLDRRGLFLLVILTLAWGINWPIMKLGVAHFPAMGFRLLGMAGGLVALGLALKLRGESLRVPRASWPTVIRLVVFAYCHLVWFALARSLPPVVSSLSIMFIPVVGVFSGMWMLGETPHWQDYAAIVLMFASLSSVLLAPLLRRRL